MRTALVTGASDGIGAAAARMLHRQGWQVAVIGRNPERTHQVARELGALAYVADFSRLAEVQTLAERLLRDYPRIDLLAHNAGGIFSKQPLTVDGHEMTFQVNHLAPFLLTRLMQERLLDCKARVISTSSVAHRSIGLFFNLADVDRPRHYSQHLAYGNAKLANILFTKELHRRLGGKGISAAAYHPGMVHTSFSKNSNSFMRLAYSGLFSKLLGMLTPEQGADTLLWLAEGQPGVDWQPGEYYVRRAPAATSRKAKDGELARALWEKSERLCAPFLTGAPKNDL